MSGYRCECGRWALHGRCDHGETVGSIAKAYDDLGVEFMRTTLPPWIKSVEARIEGAPFPLFSIRQLLSGDAGEGAPWPAETSTRQIADIAKAFAVPAGLLESPIEAARRLESPVERALRLLGFDAALIVPEPTEAEFAAPPDSATGRKRAESGRPGWAPFCLKCSTMGRMTPTPEGFRCEGLGDYFGRPGCGNEIDFDLMARPAPPRA